LQYQFVPELKMLERLAYATVRKALASKALAAASGTRAKLCWTSQQWHPSA
jgi:hypothetical protein